MPETNILRHVEHLKSNVVKQDGYPKLPQPENLKYGEIAVNYAKGLETISLKNSNNGITTFRPNTNVFVKNFLAPINTEDICEVLSVGTVYSYQDFNLTFLEVYDGDMDLFDVIDYIRNTFYDVCDLHVMLNAAKANDEDGRHTSFYINSEEVKDIMEEVENPINELSTIIGFYKYDEYFVAGDSTAMNGIEINWDCTTKAMTVRFVYMDNAYRMGGNEIEDKD